MAWFWSHPSATTHSWMAHLQGDAQALRHWLYDTGASRRLRWCHWLMLWGAGVLLLMLTLPVPVLAVTCMWIAGSSAGLGLAFCSAWMAAVLGYFLGRLSGLERLEARWGQKWSKRLSKLRHRSFWVILGLRCFPLAPFMATNVVAGGVRLRLRAFGLGTALGLLPNLLMWTWLTRQLMQGLLPH